MTALRLSGPVYGTRSARANSRIDILAIQSTAGIGSSVSALAGSASKTCRRNATSSLNVHITALHGGNGEEGGNSRSPAIRARGRGLEASC